MSVQPVFIFSLPRSGSTLLQRILALHPDIETISEPWLLLPFVYTLRDNGIFSQYNNVMLHRGISHLVSELPNGQQGYFDALRLFTENIYAQLCTKNSRYFLDKTPRYYLIIREIEKIFPEGKFIFLFRNPLATLSSILNSFNEGRLGDCMNKIDIFKGSFMLADGYRALSKNSIAIKYEDLVDQPEMHVSKICNYLSIPYHDSMVKDISNVSLPGMGDHIGTKKYSKIEKASVEKWKTFLCTNYRKKYALKYLKYLGGDTLETFGYDLDGIILELKSLQAGSNGGLRDRYDVFCSHISTFFELQMFKKKIKDKLRLKEKFYPHN